MISQEGLVKRTPYRRTEIFESADDISIRPGEDSNAISASMYQMPTTQKLAQVNQLTKI